MNINYFKYIAFLFILVASPMLTSNKLQAQNITSKTINLKAGDVTILDFVSPTGFVSYEVFPKENKQYIAYTEATGNVHAVGGNNEKGTKTVTLKFIHNTPEGPSISYRTYNLVFTKTLVQANDDAYTWDGASPLTIDYSANDEISKVARVKVNFVSKGLYVKDIANTFIVSAEEAFTTKKYVHYTIFDSTGTSDQAVISIEPKRVIEQNEEIDFIVNYTGKKSITMPSGFTAVQDPQYGILEVINENHYVYKPNNYFTGLDTFVFENAQGVKVSYNARVIDAQFDQGLVNNDVFYTPVNTEIMFDVRQNDVVTDLAIDSFSSQLNLISPGVFSLPGSFAGVKNFMYRATTDFGKETGRIRVNVGNYYPDNTDYKVDILQNSTYVMDYDAPISGYMFTIANPPKHGNVNFYDSGNTPTDCGNAEGKYLITYDPSEGFTGEDKFVLNYCINGSQCKTVTIHVNVLTNEYNACNCIKNCVYPGDLDGDGRVSASDILVLGRYMGAAGTPRDDRGTDWQGKTSTKWGVLNNLGNDLMHADANGDGVITHEDSYQIYRNFGQVKGLVPREVIGTKNFPFKVIAEPEVVDSGDVQTLYFVLGDKDIPANGIHGISFGINVSAMDSESFNFEVLENSWLTENTPYLDISKQVNKGDVKVGISIANGTKIRGEEADGFRAGGKTISGVVVSGTKIRGEEADGFRAGGNSGYGVIAKATYKIRGEEADGFRIANKSDYINKNIKALQIEMEDSDGERFMLNPSTETFILRKEYQETKVKNGADVFIYPNPVSTYLFIDNGSSTIDQITIVDAIGNTIVKQEVNNNQYQVNTANYARGIYYITIKSEQGTTSKKFFKN